MSPETTCEQNVFRLHLMPSWELWNNELSVEVSLRQQRLLAFLAVHGTCRRELVAGALWPESPEYCALDNLRVSIHKVSSTLPDLIRADRYALGLAPHVWVDLHKEWKVLDGIQIEEGLRRPSNAPLLSGWYEDWVIDEQSRLNRARISYWHRVASVALASSDYIAAIEASIQGLYLEGLDETSLEIMVLAHLELGQCISALQAIVEFRRRANHELGIASSPALDRLEARVRIAAQPHVIQPPNPVLNENSNVSLPGGRRQGVA